MSSSVVWSIPSEVIEGAIQGRLKLEVAPKVWAAGFDDTSECVNVILEIDDSDLETLGINIDDVRITYLDDGETIQ